MEFLVLLEKKEIYYIRVKFVFNKYKYLLVIGVVFFNFFLFINNENVEWKVFN